MATTFQHSTNQRPQPLQRVPGANAMEDLDFFDLDAFPMDCVNPFSPILTLTATGGQTPLLRVTFTL